MVAENLPGQRLGRPTVSAVWGRDTVHVVLDRDERERWSYVSRVSENT
uniref:Uncharacterized protein n=1 Tax=Arundo donax TaxID=35708 RepID=A0A0A9AI11_ARUDO